ncbi:MAG: VWA domain-containing protein [Bryobacteraceae bacterium]
MRGLFISAVLVSMAALAQQPQQPAPAKPSAEKPEAAPIKVQVNEVIVPVTVTDDKGRFVSNLEAKDFRILEDGREQNIAYFNRERNQPVVVGLLLDLSNTSRLHWTKFQESATELVLNLLTYEREDRYSGFLVTYGNDAELAVNTTNDPEKIVEKIRKLKPGGASTLFDAIYLACTQHKLVRGEPIEPRRVLVVIGDGNDNNSKHTLNQVVEIAQRNLVTIYGMSTKAFGFQSQGEDALIRLTQETGGRVVYPLEGVYADVAGFLSTPSDEGNYALKVGTGGYAAAIAAGMFNAIANIAGEVTTQYILRYVPKNSDSPRQFRNLSVEVKDLPNVKVRYRKGYYPYAP